MHLNHLHIACLTLASAVDGANLPGDYPGRSYNKRDVNASIVSTGSKNGAGFWPANGVAAAISTLGASWAYSWGPDPLGAATWDNSKQPEGVEFVPMIWGLKDNTADNYAKIKQSGAKILLGFNEPQYDSGNNRISSDQAMSSWAQIYNTGLRTGSPAPAGTNNTKGDWFYDFMVNAAARNMRPHFICLHHYSDNFDDIDASVTDFQNYIMGVYNFYVNQYSGDLKVWITEFGLVRYNADMTFSTPGDAKESEFVTKATKMLEGLAWVERYAWFAVPPSDYQPKTNLIDANGALTPMGKAYQAV
ncbi:MAG: hypothetical protein M1836_001374 [Candelina mexicana]|nr:MAG: hypothetical protein M1836_001374 [Candelina mexicana]